jgi:2-dehydropantoate 2-reductase
MKILVLGAGAVGGYYGARLIEGGADVTFLVRPKRAARIAERGLVVRSEAQAFSRAVKTIESVSASSSTSSAASSTSSASSRSDRYDVVLLTCKTYDLDSAIASIAPAVDAGAVVLPLLNGLAVYDVLDRRFGKERVMGGVVYVATMLDRDGDIQHFGLVDEFVVGARTADQRALAADVHLAMAKSPGSRKLSDHIEQDFWNKWVTVSTAAAVTCLMRGLVSEILASEDGGRVMESAIAESLAVAAASGYPLSEPTIAQIKGRLLNPQLEWAASMMRDIGQGASRLEVDIVGDLLKRADGFGQDAPLFRAAYVHLQVYELQQRKKNAPT